MWGVGVTAVCRTSPGGTLASFVELEVAVPVELPGVLAAARSDAAKLRGVVLAFLDGGRINEDEEA